MHLFITANILTKLMWAQVKGYIVGGGHCLRLPKRGWFKRVQCA